MKFYFILNSKLRINRAISKDDLEPAPTPIMPESTAVEVSEENYNKFLEMMNKGAFYINDEVVSVRVGLDYNAEQKWRAEQEVLFTTDPDAVKVRFIDKARVKRREIELGGFDFNGITIPSDEITQMKIQGAVLATREDPTFTTNWQVDENTFIPLDAGSINLLGIGLRNHIRDAFEQQAIWVQAIQSAASIAELEQIEAGMNPTPVFGMGLRSA